VRMGSEQSLYEIQNSCYTFPSARIKLRMAQGRRNRPIEEFAQTRGREPFVRPVETKPAFELSI
jgi:hypothetical protein